MASAKLVKTYERSLCEKLLVLRPFKQGEIETLCIFLGESWINCDLPYASWIRMPVFSTGRRACDPSGSRWIQGSVVLETLMDIISESPLRRRCAVTHRLVRPRGTTLEGHVPLLQAYLLVQMYAS